MNSQEIRDAIEECSHSLRGSDSAALWQILRALNDRITVASQAWGARITQLEADNLELKRRHDRLYQAVVQHSDIRPA